MDQSIFHLFRRVLVIVVMTYTVVQSINFVWRWHLEGTICQKPHRILRRYIEVSLLRFRFRRVWFELMQIAALGLILWALVSYHH